MRKITILTVLLIAILGINSSSSIVFAEAEPQVVKQGCDLISTGQMEKARELLGAVEDEKAKELLEVIEEYQNLSDRRDQARKETYREKLAEYEEIKAEGVPSDPNGMGDAYVALISVRQYADEQQKKELLEDEFVDKLVENTMSYNLEQEAKGKWAEAYTGYYWLSSLFEDKETYKEKSEELLDKMSIEGSLTDSPCESSAERFAGIDPVMFIRTVKMLDFGYVDLIDYEMMADKAFERCVMLAEVISFEKEDVNVEFDETQVQNWIAGVRKIRKELDCGPLARLNHKDMLDAFLKLLVLNEQTINISNEILVDHFTGAALSVLDPYTNVVWPFYTKEFEKSITQQFSGIGVEISKSTGDLTVMSLLPGTPAYNSGLDAEDVIEAVDGVPTDDMTINCAVSRITGPDGTDVTLTVRSKDADKSRNITIRRAKIVVPTIRGWQRTADAGWQYMIDPENKIGYLRITGFTGTTADYMSKAIDQLEKEGVKGLIVDLRYNSGGLLQTAGEVVDMFVDKGMIVSTKPRWGFGEELKATKKATIPNYPLVLLINGGSASASEIVAGALKDEKYQRAVLVGTRTYGKGSVQTITEAPGGGAQLKYTMAFYHLPSGQPVKNRYQLEKQGREDWGISPDFEVELTTKEAKSYIEVQKDNDVLVKADHDYKENEVARHSARETIESDPQLATAILVVKAKMIAQQ